MKRRKYTSDEAALAGRKANQKAYRERRHAAGLCIDCAEPCVNRRTCEKCCRRSLIRKHEAGRFKTYQLGAKLSPERSKYWLNLIRLSNPLLRKNWPECSSWLEKNFELYVEHSGIFFNFVPLRADEKQDEIDFRARGTFATLEDLVIAKIDYERSLECRQGKTQAEMGVESRARLAETATIEKITALL